MRRAAVLLAVAALNASAFAQPPEEFPDKTAAAYMKDDSNAFLQIPAGTGSRITVEIGMITCIGDPCAAVVQPFVRKPS